MQNFKLFLEYDGSKFAGWQRQADARTVQGEIEKAFQQVLGNPVSVIGAGRTDAGVHARGMVANVRIAENPPECDAIHSFLRGILPTDIVCNSVENADENFHARFDAVLRTYTYAVSRRKIAIGRAYAWHVPAHLDIDALHAAADYAVGSHDFTAFSKENPEVKNRVCVVSESFWRETGDMLCYTISADRFIFSMVRALVGAMVNCGRGKLSPHDFHKILFSRDRNKNANPLAPPHGLCLEKVEYRRT